MSLASLKTKWFLDFGAGGGSFPPIGRHEGSAVSASTDGNTVTKIIDGKDYMRLWHDEIVLMAAGDELYHSGWRFQGVNTLGATTPASNNALDVVNDADSAGASVYLMLDRSLPVWLRYNAGSIAWLRLHTIWTATADNRFPPTGSNHQKITCLKRAASPSALIGSIDVSKSRWDDSTHAAVNLDRDPSAANNPTHDTGIRIQGPAVADIELTFRERWNDSSRTFGLRPLLPPLPLITTPLSAPPAGGPHSVQVLHTYGRVSFGAYSWSPVGEFNIWASYLNALRTATTYIYIEDQYFFAFDWPDPCHTRPPGTARDSDLTYQLGEAIRRGVKVAVVVPGNSEDAFADNIKFQRDVAVNYLLDVAAHSTGDFIAAALHNGTDWVYVHSKLLMCDDEFTLIGSMNWNQRGMATDGEVGAGIVDDGNAFAIDLRTSLWGEHLGRAPGALTDPVAAYATFKADTLASRGHVRPYPAGAPGAAPPTRHGFWFRNGVDPYYGPPR